VPGELCGGTTAKPYDVRVRFTVDLVDLGDGVRRHPTQLYETAFLLVLAVVLAWSRERLTRDGDLFKLFMIAYLGFRLAIDFLKPERTLVAGLSLIQLASIGALVYFAPHVGRLIRSLASRPANFEA
jgi:phosphatidylglycerol---prolipoprotein diacylglyceryl transferase